MFYNFSVYFYERCESFRACKSTSRHLFSYGGFSMFALCVMKHIGKILGKRNVFKLSR